MLRTLKVVQRWKAKSHVKKMSLKLHKILHNFLLARYFLRAIFHAFEFNLYKAYGLTSLEWIIKFLKLIGRAANVISLLKSCMTHWRTHLMLGGSQHKEGYLWRRFFFVTLFAGASTPLNQVLRKMNEGYPFELPTPHGWSDVLWCNWKKDEWPCWHCKGSDRRYWHEFWNLLVLFLCNEKVKKVGEMRYK